MAVTALFVPAALRQAAGASAAVAGNMGSLYALSAEFRSIEAPAVREFKLLQALEGAAGSYPVATASAVSALRNLLALAVANASYVATGNLAASYAGRQQLLAALLLRGTLQRCVCSQGGGSRARRAGMQGQGTQGKHRTGLPLTCRHCHRCRRC